METINVEPGTTTATLIVPEGESALIYNSSTTNSITISNQNSFGLTDSFTVLLGPQGSLATDGSLPVYGIANTVTVPIFVFDSGIAFTLGTVNVTVTGGTLNVNANITNSALDVNANVTNSVIDIATPSAINVSAATVDIAAAAGYIPPALIGTLANLTITIPAATLTPGTPFQMISYPTAVSQYNGYELAAYAYANSPGSSDAPLVIEFDLRWYEDALSGIPIAEETWYCWLDRANNEATLIDNAPIVGAGPMRGQYMSMSCSILSTCTSDATLSFAYVLGTSRQYTKSTWRQDLTVVNPESDGLITINNNNTASGKDNMLVSLANFAMTAGVTYFLPIGVFAGQVSIRFHNNDATAGSTPMLVSCANIRSGDMAAGGTAQNGGIYEFPNAAPPAVAQVQWTLPRACTCLLIEGNATTVTHIDFTIIADDLG